MWARRHAGAVLVIVAALLAITLITGAAAFLLSRAWHEQARQTQLANDRLFFASQVVDEMYSSVARFWLADQPHMTPVQLEFLGRAADFYKHIAEAAPENPRPQADAAMAIAQLGGSLATQERYAEAEPVLRDAFAHIERARVAVPANVEFTRRWTEIVMALAYVAGRQHRPDEAVRLGARALEVELTLAGRLPPLSKHRMHLLYLEQSLGDALARTRPPAAESHLRRVIDAYSADANAGGAESDSQIALASAQLSLAHALIYQDRHAEADSFVAMALDGFTALDDAAAASQIIRHRTANAWNARAMVDHELGRDESARKANTAAIHCYDELVADFPDVPLYAEQLAAAKQLLHP